MQKEKYIFIKNGKKKLLFVLFFGCFISLMNAQQVPHYSQYLYNMQILNPAYVGSRADLSFSFLTRQQWVGVEGAPQTQTFSINGRMFEGIGIGLTVVNDKIGLNKTTNTNLDASYTIPTSNYGRLAFGLKGGITFFDNDFSSGITPENDAMTSFKGRYLNVGFGAYYYTQKFYIGAAIPYLLETPIFKTFETSNTNGIANHLSYFITAGRIFDITNDIKFKPSTLIKYTTNLPVSIDLNTNIFYKNILEAGISYRYQSSVSVMIAFVVNDKMRIGYAYDTGLTDFGSKLNSHEIILHFDLNRKHKKRWLYHDKCYF